MDTITEVDERFLDVAESRVAQWSMGGAFFGLTAAVVQMLIRSIIVKRNKENRRIDMGRRFNSYRRKSDRRSESFTVKPSFQRSPIIVDDNGGVMAHVLTYPYIVPVYYNFGKYDLNKLNHDYHKTTTTTSTTENPWDRIDDIRLPDSFHENLHSVFSLKNYKQYVKEDEPRIKERYDKDENLVNHHISSYDIDEEKDNYLEEYYDYEANPDDYDNDDSDQHIKITRDYLKTYFNTLY